MSRSPDIARLRELEAAATHHLRMLVSQDDNPLTPGWYDRQGAIIEAARRFLADSRPEEPPRLREAAARVIEWADHHQPWNPSGDFDALRAALKGEP